jgi:hypothetical protein
MRPKSAKKKPRSATRTAQITVLVLIALFLSAGSGTMTARTVRLSGFFLWLVLVACQDHPAHDADGRPSVPNGYSHRLEIQVDDRVLTFGPFVGYYVYVHFHSAYDGRGAVRFGYWLAHTAKSRFTYDMGGRVDQTSPRYHPVTPGPDKQFARIIEFDHGPVQ